MGTVAFDSAFSEYIFCCTIGRVQTITQRDGLTRFGAALSDPTRVEILLMLRHGPGYPADLADRLGVTPRAALTALQRQQPAPDPSHPAMAVNLDACIQCTRCVRACRETQMNDVIGLLYRGAGTQINDRYSSIAA